MYDAGILLQHTIPQALQAGKPGTEAFRMALRDAMETVKELPGTQGIYNMSKQDHSGFDERGVEVLTVENNKWKLLK